MGDLLCMNGSDHLFPQPWLGRVVAEANDLQDDLVFEVTSLPDYLSAAPVQGLERWQGELRSGSRSNMLMGVTSNRVDVKRLGALAERALWSGGPNRSPPCSWRRREWPRRAAGPGVEGDGPELGTRFDLRVLGRRCGRCRAAPLRRSARHRRRAGRQGGGVVRAVPGPAGQLRSQSRPAGAVGDGRTGGRGRGAGRLPTYRSSPSAAAFPGRWCSTPTPCAPFWECCRDPRSTTMPGCTTSPSKRTTRASPSRSPSVPRSGPTSPSPRRSRTFMPDWGRTPTPSSESA